MITQLIVARRHYLIYHSTFRYRTDVGFHTSWVEILVSMCSLRKGKTIVALGQVGLSLQRVPVQGPWRWFYELKEGQHLKRPRFFWDWACSQLNSCGIYWWNGSTTESLFFFFSWARVAYAATHHLCSFPSFCLPRSLVNALFSSRKF